MAKKMIVTSLAVFAFGFGSAPHSNAGTEMIEPLALPRRGTITRHHRLRRVL